MGHEETRPPSLSYFTIHLGLRRTFDQLRHHTLLIPRDFETGFDDLYRRRRFPEHPVVYLNSATATDPTAGPAGSTNLLAVVTSPAVEDGFDWKTNVRLSRERVLAQIRAFGIQIEANEVEFERIQTPLTFAAAHGNYRGSLYGVDPACRLFGGTFPHRNRDEDYPNLFYCGASVQPGAGLPMVTLSGKFAAQMIEAS